MSELNKKHCFTPKNQSNTNLIKANIAKNSNTNKNINSINNRNSSITDSLDNQSKFILNITSNNNSSNMSVNNNLISNNNMYINKKENKEIISSIALSDMSHTLTNDNKTTNFIINKENYGLNDNDFKYSPELNRHDFLQECDNIKNIVKLTVTGVNEVLKRTNTKSKNKDEKVNSIIRFSGNTSIITDVNRSDRNERSVKKNYKLTKLKNNSKEKEDLGKVDNNKKNKSISTKREINIEETIKNNNDEDSYIKRDKDEFIYSKHNRINSKVGNNSINESLDMHNNCSNNICNNISTIQFKSPIYNININNTFQALSKTDKIFNNNSLLNSALFPSNSNGNVNSNSVYDKNTKLSKTNNNFFANNNINNQCQYQHQHQKNKTQETNTKNKSKKLSASKDKNSDLKSKRDFLTTTKKKSKEDINNISNNNNNNVLKHNNPTSNLIIAFQNRKEREYLENRNIIKGKIIAKPTTINRYSLNTPAYLGNNNKKSNIAISREFSKNQNISEIQNTTSSFKQIDANSSNKNISDNKIRTTTKIKKEIDNKATSKEKRAYIKKFALKQDSSLMNSTTRSSNRNTSFDKRKKFSQTLKNSVSFNNSIISKEKSADKRYSKVSNFQNRNNKSSSTVDNLVYISTTDANSKTQSINCNSNMKNGLSLNFSKRNNVAKDISSDINDILTSSSNDICYNISTIKNKNNVASRYYDLQQESLFNNSNVDNKDSRQVNYEKNNNKEVNQNENNLKQNIDIDNILENTKSCFNKKTNIVNDPHHDEVREFNTMNLKDDFETNSNTCNLIINSSKNKQSKVSFSSNCLNKNKEENINKDNNINNIICKVLKINDIKGTNKSLNISNNIDDKELIIKTPNSSKIVLKNNSKYSDLINSEIYRSSSKNIRKRKIKNNEEKDKFDSKNAISKDDLDILKKMINFIENENNHNNNEYINLITKVKECLNIYKEIDI